MRIVTKAVYQMLPDGGLNLLSSEGFEYDGPLSLLGRSESHAAAEQGMQQSAQQQANAQQAYGAANKGLTDYSKNLDSFMRFGRKVYGDNGDYMRDQNTIANTTAAAGANKVAGTIAQNAMRTGANTAGMASTVAEAQRENSRDLTSQLATADSDRLAKLTAINQYGVQASALPASVQASLYGTGTSGAGSQLNAGADAAKTPGFWDVFAPALAGAAGTAAAGFCPVKGAVITLADGSKVLVEHVSIDSLVRGISYESNPLTEAPMPTLQPAIEIKTERGLTHRASRSHAVVLAGGGYARMHELLGLRILAEHGPDKVISVEDIGEQLIYPMQVGGSHSYLADGIWCLS